LKESGLTPDNERCWEVPLQIKKQKALLSLVGAAMGKLPVETGEDVTEDPDDLEEDAAAS
jgi:hypothetical protein